VPDLSRFSTQVTNYLKCLKASPALLKTCYVSLTYIYSQRAAMPCGWVVKARMVHVWVAGRTVGSRCYIRAISECFRDKELIMKHYINSYVYFYVTLFHLQPITLQFIPTAGKLTFSKCRSFAMLFGSCPPKDRIIPYGFSKSYISITVYKHTKTKRNPLSSKVTTRYYKNTKSSLTHNLQKSLVSLINPCLFACSY